MTTFFEYTPDEQQAIHVPGAIGHLVSPVQSHENGLPEWAKNSSDAYVREGASPQERVVLLVFDNGGPTRTPSISCLDFVGMTSDDIELYFRVWADPNAARAQSLADDIQGGHGNGGKAYMVNMFGDHAVLHTVMGGLGCSYGVRAGTYNFGYVPNPSDGRDFPVPDAQSRLNTVLGQVGLAIENLPPGAQESFRSRRRFTLVRGAAPKDYGRSIPVQHLLDRIVSHHQMVRTLQLCSVYVAVNGHVYDRGRALSLPSIPPLAGGEIPREVPIPKTLRDPNTQMEVSTTDDGRYLTGKLVLRTSDKNMRWVPRRYRHNIQIISRSGFIGIIEMTDLIQSYYGNRMFGECELDALEEYKTNERMRLAESPLTRSVTEWITGQVEDYAQQFVTRDRRRYSQEEANALSQMNSALDRWKNHFMDSMLASLTGNEGEGSFQGPSSPLPRGEPAKIELALSHSLAGAGVSLRPTLRFLDSTGHRVRPVPFHWQSSDSNVALVDEDINLVTTFSFGSTSLYAETLDGRLRSNEVGLDVVHIYAIRLEPSEVEVRSGGRQQLRAVCQLADGRQSSDVYLVWTEDNPSVANVSAAGLVFGRDPGETTVVAGDDHSMSRRPARIIVLPESGGGGDDRRGRAYPKILVSEIDADPETEERVEFGREDPPVWQRPTDVERNIWWINSASPLANLYLDRDKGYGYNTREWRIYHLERIIEAMIKIAIADDASRGEDVSLDSWQRRWDEMAAAMQGHAASSLGEFIDNGALPEDGGAHG